MARRVKCDHSKPRPFCKGCPAPPKGYRWCRCGTAIFAEFSDCHRCKMILPSVLRDPMHYVRRDEARERAEVVLAQQSWTDFVLVDPMPVPKQRTKVPQWAEKRLERSGF